MNRCHDYCTYTQRSDGNMVCYKCNNLRPRATYAATNNVKLDPQKYCFIQDARGAGKTTTFEHQLIAELSEQISSLKQTNHMLTAQLEELRAHKQRVQMAYAAAQEDPEYPTYLFFEQIIMGKSDD